MPYPAAIGFEFLFWKLGYRFVKFTEYRGFVVGQCSGYRHCIGNVMTKQIDLYLQSVNKCPHLHKPFDFRLFHMYLTFEKGPG